MKWLNDTKGRIRMGLWARQSGKSLATAVKKTLRAILKHRSCMMLSAGERQSRELLDKCVRVAQALEMQMAAKGATLNYRTTNEELQFLDGRGKRLAKIVALPSNPRTVRGFTGDLVIDEFAHHADQKEIWRAALPMITRGNYECDIISTPCGSEEMFATLWHDTRNGFSKHSVTVVDAMREGLVLYNQQGGVATVDDIKEMIGDEEAFRQEYMCEFLDESTSFLEHALITQCESDVATEEFEGPFDGRALYAGWDIARWRDLAVMWVIEKMADDRLVTRAVFVFRRCPFEEQWAVFESLMTIWGVRRAAIDATGMGEPIGERAVTRWGEHRIAAVRMTSETILGMATPARAAMEGGRLLIPRSPEIHNDLHSVKKDIGALGRIKLTFGRTDGHADRFVALMLASSAAECSRVTLDLHMGPKMEFSGKGTL